MTDFHDLYQELILDHNKRPRNRRHVDGADREARGYNPLCGDRVTIFLTLDGDTIADIAFEGSGCAISTASASLMTEAVQGKTIEEAEALFKDFYDLVMAENGIEEPGELQGKLGKLGVFSGVSNYPARVKCATLAWHTVHEALKGGHDVVTTE